MGVGRNNSVGGRNVFISPIITSNKTIKYVTPSFSVYNEVQDKVNCNIRGNNVFRGKATGPYNFGDKEHWRWENAYYNWSIHCIKLLSINIEYMDGRKEIFEGDDISRLYAPEKYRTSAGDNRLSKYGTVCGW